MDLDYAALQQALERAIEYAGLPTLRDQIAMAALNGMLTHSDTGRWEDFATQAYRFADALLAARAAKPEPGK